MAPRKRRGPATSVARTSLISQVAHINTRGLPALADEIYLEIISHIPSVPIPTTEDSPLYAEIRRYMRETFFSLSQTCRSLRRVFLRYVWQRIEVRKGIKTGENKDLKTSSRGQNKASAVELVRQLEIVTIRNPHLAQYVNYLDIFIGQYSFDTVVLELARCMSLFSNLHTVQIELDYGLQRVSEQVFERTFKKYSYPQIRNAFVMSLSVPLLSSFPEAKRVGFTERRFSSEHFSEIARSCPRLEVLDNFDDGFCIQRPTDLIAINLRSLRYISIFPVVSSLYYFSCWVQVLAKMNHLQTIVLTWPRYSQGIPKTQWIESLKNILIDNRGRDNLVKFLIVKDGKSGSQTITLQPRTEDSL